MVGSAWVVESAIEMGARKAEDRLLGAGEDQHILRLEPFVEGRDLGTKERVPRGLGVAEGQPIPHRPGLLVGEIEEVRHRVALDVRRAQQVLDGELPAGEEALQGEVGDAHRRHHRRPRSGPRADARVAMLTR